MQGLGCCHECRRCRSLVNVPYPRRDGLMGSSCDTMTPVLTAVLDLERGMLRGIGVCICA